MGGFIDGREARACGKAEREAGFDRAKAERDLDEVMRKLGIGTGAGDSVVPGVAVYYCDDMIDEEKIERMLVRRGHEVAEVRSTVWIGADGLDERAVAVAFDVPCLAAGWGHGAEEEASPAP